MRRIQLATECWNFLIFSLFQMNYSRNPFFKHFGLEISDKFLQVEAKVLQPPRLLVGGGRAIEPRYLCVVTYLFLIRILQGASACKNSCSAFTYLITANYMFKLCWHCGVGYILSWVGKRYGVEIKLFNNLHLSSFC